LGSDVLGEGPEPCEVAADGAGRVYVAAPGSGDVLVFQKEVSDGRDNNPTR